MAAYIRANERASASMFAAGKSAARQARVVKYPVALFRGAAELVGAGLHQARSPHGRDPCGDRVRIEPSQLDRPGDQLLQVLRPDDARHAFAFSLS
ncbi:hypothetical protein [Nonomuraea jabiensis]|uniref:hypothetical protein n=1 Tax=Nonomuraea jabiensis TaxID=882448 RepID=UPI0036892B53